MTVQLPPGGWDNRVRPDDEIYQHDKSYLGPAPYTLPFRIPYRAIPVAAGVFVPGLLVLRVIGVGGLALYLIDLAVSCAAAAAAARFTGPERPLSAVAAIALHEASAPRPPRVPPRPATETLRPGLVPVTGPPARRHRGGRWREGDR